MKKTKKILILVIASLIFIIQWYHIITDISSLYPIDRVSALKIACKVLQPIGYDSTCITKENKQWVVAFYNMDTLGGGVEIRINAITGMVEGIQKMK